MSICQLLIFSLITVILFYRLLFKNGEYFNSEGVQIRAAGFGDTASVEYLDSYGYVAPYFYYFVEFFAKHGYVRGVSLRAAPYDWRFTPGICHHSNHFTNMCYCVFSHIKDILEKNCYYDNVQQLIETMYKSNGNSSVTIVTHSMGSSVMLYFLTQVARQEWKEKYLKAFVPLSGAWKGSVTVLLSIVTGDPQGIPGVPTSTVRKLQRSSPSSYFLMPIPDHNIWSRTDPIVITLNKNYTVYDYAMMFDDMQYSVGYIQYKAVPSFLTTLPPPNVDTYCYYGMDIPTPTTLVYEEGEFPDTFPSIITGNGDGMVNSVSLQACSMWKQAQSHKVNVKSFSGIDHIQIVRDSTVLQAILDIVSN